MRLKFYIQVRIGEHDLTDTDAGSYFKEIAVAAYKNHESYDSSSNEYDITVITLNEAVDLATYTPACMAKTSDTTTFDLQTALAYGKTIILAFT